MKQSSRLSLTYIMENKKLAESKEAVLSGVINTKLQKPENGEEKSTESLLRQDEDEAEAILQNLFGELHNLVGLSGIKDLVREIRAYIEICRRRQRFHLKTESLVLHMVFKGNPGTGKTTVARILGKMMAQMQVLPKGHLLEVERADLVGEYIGHTAQKTKEKLKQALGGILFIDEAYSLARGGEKDFGKEAVDALVKAMEDNKNQLIIILAGYENEMENFLLVNPGIRSRFPIHMNFPDYSCNELLEIAQVMVKERQYLLSPGAVEYLRRYLQNEIEECRTHFSNARLVRNLIERAIRRQALRLVDKKIYGREELMQLILADFLDSKESGFASPDSG